MPYRPEALFGAIALILLFNIYEGAGPGRDELVRELIRAEAEEMLALLDPVNRALQPALP